MRKEKRELPEKAVGQAEEFICCDGVYDAAKGRYYWGTWASARRKENLALLLLAIATLPLLYSAARLLDYWCRQPVLLSFQFQTWLQANLPVLRGAALFLLAFALKLLLLFGFLLVGLWQGKTRLLSMLFLLLASSGILMLNQKYESTIHILYAINGLEVFSIIGYMSGRIREFAASEAFFMSRLYATPPLILLKKSFLPLIRHKIYYWFGASLLLNLMYYV